MGNPELWSVVNFCQVKFYSCRVDSAIVIKIEVVMDYIRGDLVEEISKTQVWCIFENCERGRNGRRPEDKTPGMSGQDSNIRRHYKKVHGYEWSEAKRIKISDSEKIVLIPSRFVTIEQYWNNISAIHCQLNLSFAARSCFP